LSLIFHPFDCPVIQLGIVLPVRERQALRKSEDIAHWPCGALAKISGMTHELNFNPEGD
jgi:hypothetical protein